MRDKSILKKFPKQRINLPQQFIDIYNTHYFTNRNGKYATTSISQKLESWMHRKVAADILKNSHSSSTLEIGAGTLNQLLYEPIDHIRYDIVEPFGELFQDSPLLSKVSAVYKDISDIKNVTYDRITTVATFEHIMDLPAVVAQGIKLLKKDGHMRVAIPNEGTLMWWLGTQVTGFEFKKKYNLDYQTLMKYEHVNTADDIEKVLRYFFDKVECSVFGITKKLAFYRFYNCSHPNFDIVNSYLKSHEDKHK